MQVLQNILCKSLPNFWFRDELPEKSQLRSPFLIEINSNTVTMRFQWHQSDTTISDSGKYQLFRV